MWGLRVREAARRAARRMARGGAAAAAAGAAGAPAPESAPPPAPPAAEQAGGSGSFGTPDFMDWLAGLMARPACPGLDVDERRANAAAENQRASAPCDCCRRLMPASGRCAECRASGVWYCAACHDRLADMADRRLNAAAENQRASAPCDGCRRVMRAADRCDDCRSMGMWFCDGCHAVLEGLAARHAAADDGPRP